MPPQAKKPAPAKRVLIKRTFTGAGRGRPTRGAVSDQDLFDIPRISRPGNEVEEKALYEESFRAFLFSCFDFPDLDEHLHGGLADFIGRPKGSRPRAPVYYKTRSDLLNRLSEPVGEPTADQPYGIDLGGDLLGVASVEKGDGSCKLTLIPRNHLKSTVISVAYVLWRIVKNPAIRILICSAVAKDARKFLRAIKWQLMNNKKIAKYWPNVHITKEMIADCSVIWTQQEITVPRTVVYEAGESTVEAMGVGGNLVSRHYDLIIKDDLVNNKNSRTAHLLGDTIEWAQNANSLLDPVTGEDLVVGTRWDYADYYSHLLAEHSDVYSLYFATVYGTDKEVFYPKKFDPAKVAAIRKIHGPYKFSCQYLNQPVDKEKQDFKFSWLRYYWVDGENGTNLDKKGRPVLPSGFSWNFYAAMDVAITEDDGDYTVITVVAVNDKNDWYVQDVFYAQYGDIDKIVEMMFEVQTKYPEIMQFGVETRGWQRTIASGAEAQMKRRNCWLSIVELKSESNESKASRIMRLVPRCASGGLFLPGKDHQRLSDGMKILFNQYTRFPRGGDDFMDSLAYIDMLPATPPSPLGMAKSEPRTASERAKAHRKRIVASRVNRTDEHLGVVW